ncbi:protein of unknown function [Candidatus Nitrosocaldus cavascurensis]|uniref:Uncharacterized protein n=1 Tax=Candidatus Nitrosocaldus cavascurensis TaxID=2058097 RepID=A0A2K5ARH8_9ARCH|nr:protein of unknown function [Candidatus Nitrosocaldus cavascurensis]
MQSLNRTIVGLKVDASAPDAILPIRLNRTIVGLKVAQAEVNEEWLGMFESNYSRIESVHIGTRQNLIFAFESNYSRIESV